MISEWIGGFFIVNSESALNERYTFFTLSQSKANNMLWIESKRNVAGN